MATLAQIFDRFNTRMLEQAPPMAVADPSEAFRLRMFPNEDVYFFVKKIDNSGVVRESDPKARRTCWGVIGASCAVAVFLTGLLLPSVQGLLAGYKIEALRAERHRLQQERSVLDFQETKLLTTEHLSELARQQEFVDASTPQKIVYLDGKPDGTMARVTVPAGADAKR